AYVPLDRCHVLDTANDPRYQHLGSKLAQPLPVCHRAHYGEAVRLRANVLLAERGDLELLGATVGALASAGGDGGRSLSLSQGVQNARVELPVGGDDEFTALVQIGRVHERSSRGIGDDSPRGFGDEGSGREVVGLVAQKDVPVGIDLSAP